MMNQYLSTMPCVIEPGMFLITPLSLLLPNPHPPNTSLAHSPEISPCFSNVTVLNSDGPLKALLHMVETPLGIIVHCSDSYKESRAGFLLSPVSFLFEKEHHCLAG